MAIPAELVEKLTQFEILSDFKNTPNALVILSQVLSLKTFQSREPIIDENTPAPEMYFLLEGKAAVNKISDSGEIVRIANLDGKLHPFFGEAAILGFTTRSANVIAETQCKCLALTKEDFELFSQDNPIAAISFFKKLARGLYQRMSKADQDLFIIGIGVKS